MVKSTETDSVLTNICCLSWQNIEPNGNQTACLECTTYRTSVEYTVLHCGSGHICIHTAKWDLNDQIPVRPQCVLLRAVYLWSEHPRRKNARCKQDHRLSWIPPPSCLVETPHFLSLCAMLRRQGQWMTTVFFLRNSLSRRTPPWGCWYFLMTRNSKVDCKDHRLQVFQSPSWAPTSGDN